MHAECPELRRQGERKAPAPAGPRSRALPRPRGAGPAAVRGGKGRRRPGPRSNKPTGVRAHAVVAHPGYRSERLTGAGVRRQDVSK